MTDPATLLVEQRGAVTLLTLNRPEALNALSSAVLEELIAAFAAFELGLEQGIVLERRQFQILASTADKAEGMAAFIEKRPAVWKGK